MSSARQLCASALLLLAVTLSPRRAYAELYSYVDEQGVVHFTNLPALPGKNVYPVGRSTNTFEWTDELGVLRRVHRVGVAVYDALVREAAAHYSLPAALVKAVIAVESGFEPTAVSPKGARGLMQLMPDTAKEMFVRNSFDPRENIFGGARYLRIMANQFNGDVRLTIAAYNAGPEAVTRSGGVPEYPETQRYVRRVLKLYRHYLKEWSSSSPSN